MDIEFHYYINYLIALPSMLVFNLKSQLKIAYSAQYVDDNTVLYNVISYDKNTIYQSTPSQSFNPLIDIKTSIEIYPVFHFVPGDDVIKSSMLRRDGECRHMSTLPNSKPCTENATQSIE